MSFFKKKYHYSIPERLTPSEARERRLAALLEREQRFMAVPNFPEKIQAARSQVAKEKRLSLTQRIVNDPQSAGHKAASIAAALSRFNERSFADPQARAAYRKLRAVQDYYRSQENQAQQKRNRQNAPPSGGNKSYFNPTGKEFAATIYGTAARLAGRLLPMNADSWLPVFANPGSVLPCIQRSVRREVMFAKKHAGRGYHTRKRRTWSSGIPC